MGPCPPRNVILRKSHAFYARGSSGARVPRRRDREREHSREHGVLQRDDPVRRVVGRRRAGASVTSSSRASRRRATRCSPTTRSSCSSTSCAALADTTTVPTASVHWFEAGRSVVRQTVLDHGPRPWRHRERQPTVRKRGLARGGQSDRSSASVEERDRGHGRDPQRRTRRTRGDAARTSCCMTIPPTRRSSGTRGSCDGPRVTSPMHSLGTRSAGCAGTSHPRRQTARRSSGATPG